MTHNSPIAFFQTNQFLIDSSRFYINARLILCENVIIATNVIIAPEETQCVGEETYNEDLSGNGFLEAFGPGHKINKVISVRTKNFFENNFLF